MVFGVRWEWRTYFCAPFCSVSSKFWVDELQKDFVLVQNEACCNSRFFELSFWGIVFLFELGACYTYVGQQSCCSCWCLDPEEWGWLLSVTLYWSHDEVNFTRIWVGYFLSVSVFCKCLIIFLMDGNFMLFCIFFIYQYPSRLHPSICYCFLPSLQFL